MADARVWSQRFPGWVGKGIPQPHLSVQPFLDTCASDAREHTAGPVASEAEASNVQKEGVYLENGVKALGMVTGKPL